MCCDFAQIIFQCWVGGEMELSWSTKSREGGKTILLSTCVFATLLLHSIFPLALDTQATHCQLRTCVPVLHQVFHQICVNGVQAKHSTADSSPMKQYNWPLCSAIVACQGYCKLKHNSKSLFDSLVSSLRRLYTGFQQFYLLWWIILPHLICWYFYKGIKQMSNHWSISSNKKVLHNSSS